MFVRQLHGCLPPNDQWRMFQILMNMGEIGQYLSKTKQDNKWTVCKCLGLCFSNSLDFTI